MEIKTKVDFISYEDYLHGKANAYWRGSEITFPISRQKIIAMWPEPKEEWHLVLEENQHKRDVSLQNVLNLDWGYVINEVIEEDWVWFSTQDKTSYCKTCWTNTNKVELYEDNPIAIVLDIPCLFAHVVY